MNKFFSLVFLMLFNYVSNAQNQPDTIRNSLQQLSKPTRVLPKYVNFDVFKFFMVGHGRGTLQPVQYGTGFSFRMQVVCPYALWKYDFPIAYGITFGSSKITARSTKLDFDGKELVAINDDKSIKSTMQRTSYIGATALKVIRVKPLGMTILAGGSLEYNLFSRLKVRAAEDTKGYSSRKYIERISTPLHLQISISKKQFLSCGIFGSYDLQPRFKGKGYRDLKQVTAGLSIIAFII